MTSSKRESFDMDAGRDMPAFRRSAIITREGAAGL
ncbi:hypothetical protein FHS26_006475 [Rhizobium pisi]|uniref:Uncharacterized protein n=1 Tax=Rhizobium pisi TaxID=574561 RepID=A0A7W5G3U7_9HYPH|nr:hypothetical protein [Rhizobium pisi]